MKIKTILIALLLGTASSLSMALTKTTTTLTSSRNPSIYGQPVTFTGVVTPAPPDGETVTFLQGKTPLGCGTLSSGTATYTTSTLTAGGTDTIKAQYNSDGTYEGSMSNAVKQVVDKASTTTKLVSSPNPSGAGQAVNFTATVTPEYSGTPTGNASFYNGSAKLGAVTLAGGVASYTTTKLPVGNNSITADYSGSSSFIGSDSNAVSQSVNPGKFIDSWMTYGDPPITRYYEVYLPGSLLPNPPMVLMLHGTQTTKSTGSDPEPIISLNWGWQSIADQNGFILVKPASTYDPQTHQWNWNAYCMDGATTTCYPFGWNGGAFPYAEGCAEADCPDDSGFLRALIVSLRAQYAVDPDRVYVAGFSSGAQMAHRAGVELSDIVAAIVAGSGELEGQQLEPLPLFWPKPPIPFPPISVQEWHGTLDNNLWPCNYGTTKYNGVTFYLDTVDDTFNFWTVGPPTGLPTDSCTTFKTTQPLCLNGAPNNANDAPMLGIQGLTGNDATGCTNNVEVQFIWEPNVGHSWQQQYNAQRWVFFSSHPMQATLKKESH